jgi:hypothetical protein
MWNTITFKKFLNFTPRKKFAESAFLLAASTFTSGKLQDFWSSGLGFRQGLRQRSVSREALGPRMGVPGKGFFRYGRALSSQAFTGRQRNSIWRQAKEWSLYSIFSIVVFLSFYSFWLVELIFWNARYLTLYLINLKKDFITEFFGFFTNIVTVYNVY